MEGLEEEAAAAKELEGLIQQAEAVRVLDGLERAGPGRPQPDRLAAARAAYHHLQSGALRALSDLAALQRRMAHLTARLQAQQQAAQQGFANPVQLVDSFREDLNHARQEAEGAADAEEAAERQAAAQQQRLAVLAGRLADAEEERCAELAPELRDARNELAFLASQLEHERGKAVAARHEASDIASRLQTLQYEVEGLRAAAEEEREGVSQAEAAPGRARQQADLATAALRQLRDEEQEVALQLRDRVIEEQAREQEAHELMAQHAAAARAADRLRNRLAAREREAEEAARDVEMARVEAEKLLAEQVGWDLELEKKAADAKREGQALKAEERGRGVVQRRLNRAEPEAKQLQEELPGMRNTLHNLRAALAAERRVGTRGVAGLRALQAELEAAVEEVARERQLTEVQAALVRASMEDARHLDEECAEVKAAAAERDQAVRLAASQRDAALRTLNQRLQRLSEVVDEAEAKDGELEELRKKRAQTAAARRDQRHLCGLMSGQMGRFHAVLGSARRSAEKLQAGVEAADGELAALKQTVEERSGEAAAAERARARGQAERAALTAQLSAARWRAATVGEAADAAGTERALAARGAEEGQQACEQLAAAAAAALEAKRGLQRRLLERSEEMCELYGRSAALQLQLDQGAASLQRSGDDMRLLQLEAAELQRCMAATHRSTPDVAAYDRQIAALKAEVLRARREAEDFGAALESPAEGSERCRMLPGRLPSREDLAGRIAQIDERLRARQQLALQRDSVLQELERLTEGLLEQAQAGQHPCLDLGLRMNEARRAQQGLTRRMMAAVSELSLYQALSLKCASDRDQLRAELAAARQNLAEGRPPTAGADQEFERMERDRREEAEVRAQAAELRQLKAAGLLGVPRSTAPPRPQAYIPEDLGVPKPFPAAFRPFKPSEPSAAAVTAAERAAASCETERAATQQQQQQVRCGSPGAAAARSPVVCSLRVASPVGGSPCALPMGLAVA